jgi:hypothetical protein
MRAHWVVLDNRTPDALILVFGFYKFGFSLRSIEMFTEPIRANGVFNEGAKIIFRLYVVKKITKPYMNESFWVK